MIIVRKDKKRKPGIRKHSYKLHTKWLGNAGHGTKDYVSYSRDVLVSAPGKEDLKMSSDPVFLGDDALWTPEDFLLASLSTCHKLWYLALASINDLIVVAYEDNPEGVMIETSDGSGAFQSVTLHPEIKITDPDKLEIAHEINHVAHEKCFIANSVNFDVRYDPKISVELP